MSIKWNSFSIKRNERIVISRKLKYYFEKNEIDIFKKCKWYLEKKKTRHNSDCFNMKW